MNLHHAATAGIGALVHSCSHQAFGLRSSPIALPLLSNSSFNARAGHHKTTFERSLNVSILHYVIKDGRIR